MSDTDTPEEGASFTVTNLDQVEDMAIKYGYSETNESRFATEDLEAKATGVSHHRIRPDARQPFAHRHKQAEEVYVVLAGSGRIKLGDEIVEITELDAIRISPEVVRALEAGPDGLEVLAFGPRHKGESEMIQDFWDD